MSGNIPLIIIPLVADTIGKEMDQTEGLMGLSRQSASQFLREEPDEKMRSLLETMSLVCRKWTKPAQAVLRRRFFLHDSNIPELPGWLHRDFKFKFLNGSMCGPWVREVLITPNYYKLSAAEIEQRTISFAQLFKRFNLVALSIKPLGVSLEWAPILLKPVVHLRTLRMSKAELYTLPGLYEAVANLHKLEVLSLECDCGSDDEESRPCQPLAPKLIRTHPPASLKKLHFQINFNRDETPTTEILSWILQARGEYAPRELRLIVSIPYNIWDEEEDVWDEEDSESCRRILVESMLNTLPPLQTLLFREDSFRYPTGIDGQIFQRCNQLKDIHLFGVPGYPLPASVEKLCWGHETLETGPSHPTLWDEPSSEYLQSQLACGKMPNLRFVHICGGKDINSFPRTKKICDEFNIALIPGCDLEDWTPDKVKLYYEECRVRCRLLPVTKIVQ